MSPSSAQCRESDQHEVEALRATSALPRDHPGRAHLVHYLDSFMVVGPNGTHGCLVLDVLGPSMPDPIGSFHQDERLPATQTKLTARQVLQGINFLARNEIDHGGKSTVG